MKYLHRLLLAASAAFFFASAALAQNSGTVTNRAFAIGKGAGQTGFTSLLCASTQIAIGQTAANPACFALSGDITMNASGVTAIGATKVTSAMLNADVYSTAHTWAGQQTFVAPILGTPASGTLTNATGLPISTGVSGLGTGIAAALAVNTGSAGAPVLFNGALGAPSSGTLTNATGLPIGTGVSGLGAGCATFLGTPSSANLRGCLTDEVGTGAAYFVGGALGTPASGTATNLTGLPLSGLNAQAAWSFVVNNTSGSASPTAVDIPSFTLKASPAATDLIVLSDQAASGALKRATISSIASAGSVSSIAGNTGAFTLAGGVTNSTNQIQLDAAYTGTANTNCTLAASVASNNLTIALKDNAGNDPSATSPCFVNFRNVTATTGSTSAVAVTAATSVVFNSGSGFGAPSSSTPFRIWVTAWNNAGTVVLGASNQTGTLDIFPLNEGAVQSSTACSACATATSAGTFYTTAAQTSKAIRILGYLEWASGLTTTGVWASGPTTIQVMGPSIKNPGETVRRSFMSSTSATNTATTSTIASNVAKNITKTSAANPVRLDLIGYAVNNTGTTGGFKTQFYRGSAACTTAIGIVGFGTIIGSNTGNNGLQWIDVPAASGTTAANYTVCISSPNSLSMDFPYAGSGATLILEEIMG